MTEWWTDLRLAGRSLRRSPGFTAAAVVVLALGIGANAAVFTAVRATLLSAPPYAEPDRIVLLDMAELQGGRDALSRVAGGLSPRTMPWSYPKYRILAEWEGLLADPVAAFAVRSLTLTGGGDATVLSAELVSPAYLEVLGVAPALGRDFDAGDDTESAPPTALLGYALWEERLGADPGVVGRSVILNGRPTTVVGVLPAGFRGLSGDASLWVPVHTGASLVAPFLVRGAQAHWLRSVGRLRDDASLTSLDEQMVAIGTAVEEAYPTDDPTRRSSVTAQRLAEARLNPQARSMLLVLSAAAALLLIVACANLAGLAVARATARGREIAVRRALGAGRWRIARRFLVESVLLAAMGGLAAVVVARFGVDWLVAAWPSRFLDGSWNVEFADLTRVRMDGGVMAFVAGVTVLAGVLFGAVPGLATLRVRSVERLREGASGSIGGSLGRWDVRRGLVSAEIALSLVLLVGAGLLLRSLERLASVERGYEPGNLVAFDVTIPRTSGWADDAAGFAALYLERLRALPDVLVASSGCTPPLSGHCFITAVDAAGPRTFEVGSQPGIGVHYVSDDYFATLGIPLREGRTFSSSDRADSAPVVVLSEMAARELFPEGDALGNRLSAGAEPIAEEGVFGEIVGIVGDVLYDRPEYGLMPEMYLSHRQGEGLGTVFLRTRREPLAVIPAARAALRELAPDLPISSVRTFQDVEASASSDTRVLGALLSVFAALALLLACTGVWAVVAYTVSRRTRELGVRMALGAETGRVVGLVLRAGIAPALGGVAVGGLAAWLASRLLTSLLFEITPSDPLSFAAGGGLLLAVSLLAAWLPARRATRIDPVEALRAD